MPSEFTIAQHPIDSERHVVAVRGDLDLFTASELKKVFAQAIGAGRIRIIVDLAETTFVDSSALGVLIAALKRLLVMAPSRSSTSTRTSLRFSG